jgi:hypothetical protein
MTNKVLDELKNAHSFLRDPMLELAIERIEELQKALDFYKCGCSKDKCTPEKPRFRSIKCGWIARAALEES